MAWDTYVVIAIVSGLFGFYFVKSFQKKCPRCQEKLQYLGAENPKSQSKNVLNYTPQFFSGAKQENRIKFLYECPSCQVQVTYQGRQVQMIDSD